MKDLKLIFNERKFINKMVKYIKIKVLNKETNIAIQNYNYLSYLIFDKYDSNYENLVIDYVGNKVKEYCFKYHDYTKERVIVEKISNKVAVIFERKLAEYLIESRYEYKTTSRNLVKILKVIPLIIITMVFVMISSPNENLVFCIIMGIFIGQIIYD